MACGKTTLGRAISNAGYADFVDLDEFITARSGMTPAEWFAGKGEEAFRQAEIAALEDIVNQVIEGRHLVIATGGGTPCSTGAMDLMRSRGTVVWLEASLDRTVARLLEAEGKRPLVAGMDEAKLRQFIPTHRGERNIFYQRAHARVDSSLLDNEEEIKLTVADFVSRFKI